MGHITWPGVPDPTTFVHPYLFEHRPDRNFWSLFRTFLGGHRAKRFWRTLHPAQAVRPWRSVCYWLTVLLIYLGTLGFTLLAYGITASQKNVLDRAGITLAFNAQTEATAEVVTEYGRFEAFLDHQYPTTILGSMRKGLHEVDFQTLFTLSLLVAWPWITLLFFRLGLPPCAVGPFKSVHCLRVVLYCSDSIVWTCGYLLCVNAILMAASILELLAYMCPPHMRDWLFTGLVGVFAISALLWIYRLSIAARWYLNARHSFIMVLFPKLSPRLFSAMFQSNHDGIAIKPQIIHGLTLSPSISGTCTSRFVPRKRT